MSKPKVASLPHSWAVSAWPEHVFPNRQSAATHLVRRIAKSLCGCTLWSVSVEIS